MDARGQQRDEAAPDHATATGYEHPHASHPCSWIPSSRREKSSKGDIEGQERPMDSIRMSPRGSPFRHDAQTRRTDATNYRLEH
jgi:hypothetical protein